MEVFRAGKGGRGSVGRPSKPLPRRRRRLDTFLLPAACCESVLAPPSLWRFLANTIAHLSEFSSDTEVRVAESSIGFSRASSPFQALNILSLSPFSRFLPSSSFARVHRVRVTFRWTREQHTAASFASLPSSSRWCRGQPQMRRAMSTLSHGRDRCPLGGRTLSGLLPLTPVAKGCVRSCSTSSPVILTAL